MSKAVADTSIFIAQETGCERGRRLRRHDTWIAATAMHHRAAVLTQDADFMSFQGVEVIRA